ncbi:unnamed protein product [Paramecium pentaurelia]|uniref:Protein kinase domain-containing protein n=1 Tax=Paramecium pentaurelia TaxID=43138 RepID=A0A8S1U3G1_9CILI|nr:unnamed protein product [Paramecium pentaurelia]
MNRQNQKAIRASLKKALFNDKRRNACPKQGRQNSSPPIPNNQPRAINQQFRHFSDVYEYGDEQIGEGAHGIVKKCYRRDPNNNNGASDRVTYAVKVFRTGDTEVINTIRETFHLHRGLNDLNCVVKVLDLFINSKKEEHHLVMEYCPFPSLEQRIGSFCEEDIQQITLNLAQSLFSLHQRGICHRDLKPDNILISDQFSIKLIDFGVSKRFLVKGKVTKKIDMWTRTGSLFYQAPEIFMGGGYDEKIDIWSAGIILYQLLFGQLPFQSETILDTIEMITDSKLNSTFLGQLNPLIQDLLKRLLEKDPNKRLSAEGFVLHPWLHTTQQKKSNKSFDDCDIIETRINENILQTSQITILRQNQRYQDQLMVPIQEEREQNSLKNSWNYWENHVHYVPQDVIRMTNLDHGYINQSGTSQELVNDQKRIDDLTDFQIGLVRTNSEQFDQL